MSTVHTYPVNDLIAHEYTDECPCGPAVEPVVNDEDGSIGWQIIHHSLDGREFHEGKS